MLSNSKYDVDEQMIQITSCQIFQSTDQIRAQWNSLAKSNLFLSVSYLRFLENASPANFTNYFIGFYVNDELEGIALAQKIDLRQVAHFGQRDSFFKKILRKFLFKNFSGQLFIVGNNLMTGSHPIYLRDQIDPSSALLILENLIQSKWGKQIHLTIWKDIGTSFLEYFNTTHISPKLNFKAQPGMMLQISPNWKSLEDYTQNLFKKYRDQFKRSRKKGEVFTKKIFDLDDLRKYEEKMHELYLNVANHAPFNTFFLPSKHFIELKIQLGNHFHVCAYFLEDELVGFNSIILNHPIVETYFLGYEEQVQKDGMLYLNMLYDMLEFGILRNYPIINYGRTAMEIKSSIGAKPVWFDSYMMHQNTWINRFLAKFYHLLEPKVDWKERHPFKLN
jgi:hypothetical protein